MYWKYLVLDNWACWNLAWKYFKMSQQYFEENKIFLSQYCVRKCLVCISPLIGITALGHRLSTQITPRTVFWREKFPRPATEWFICRHFTFYPTFNIKSSLKVILSTHSVEKRCSRQWIVSAETYFRLFDNYMYSGIVHVFD